MRFGVSVTTIILVEEDDVGFPDFAGHDAYDSDAAELARFPAKLVVLPQLCATNTRMPLCTRPGGGHFGIARSVHPFCIAVHKNNSPAPRTTTRVRGGGFWNSAICPSVCYTIRYDTLF